MWHVYGVTAQKIIGNVLCCGSIWWIDKNQNIDVQELYFSWRDADVLAGLSLISLNIGTIHMTHTTKSVKVRFIQLFSVE